MCEMDRTALKNSPYTQQAILIRIWESTSTGQCLHVISFILFLSLEICLLEEQDMGPVLSQTRVFSFQQKMKVTTDSQDLLCTAIHK